MASMAAVLLTTTVGCMTERSDASVAVTPLLARIHTLENELEDLRGRIATLAIAQAQYRRATIDPSSKAVQRLDTSVGTFLISCEDVSPYAHGYKVHLSIGNVTMAKLKGFKLNVSWGPAFGDTTVRDWDAARHEQAFAFTDDLLPGRWNKVSFVVTPAEPRDLDLVTVGMESDVVSLWQ